MSGSISFASVYGKGTVFTFNIKDSLKEEDYTTEDLKNLSQEERKERPGSLSNSFEGLNKTAKRLLVVDDDNVCGHIVANYCKMLKISAEVV